MRKRFLRDKTIAGLAIAVALLLFVLYAFLREQCSADPVSLLWLIFFVLI
ncbi:MAG: hypothetical protein LC768_15415 [Acidobacteria bacterium]|nr:hypothetical protein [Acidobacteriota bacterium]